MRQVLLACGLPIGKSLAEPDLVGEARAVIDATRPYEWREKFPKVSGASRELKDKVAADWRQLLERKIGRALRDDSAFDRLAFAMRALDVLKPKNMKVVVYERIDDMLRRIAATR